MAGESKRSWVRHWAQQEARMTVALNQRVAQDAKDAALRDALLNPADFDHVNRLVQAFVVISTKLKTPHEGAEAEINDQVFHKLLDDGLLEAAGQRLQYMIDQGMLNEKGSADRQTRVTDETSQQRVDQALGWLMTETGTDLAQAKALTRKAGWGAFLGLTPAEETKAKTLALAALSQSRHLKDKGNSEEAKKVWLECGDLAKSGDLAGALERLRKSRAVSDSALEALVERAAAGPPVTYQGTAARVMLGILEGKIRTLDQAVQAGLNLDKIKDASALIDQMGTVKASGRIRMVREKLRELENSYLRGLPDGLKERAGNAFLSSVFHRWNGSKWDDSVGEAVRRAGELVSEFQLPSPRKEDRSHQVINTLGNLPSGWFLQKAGAGSKGSGSE
jgi:hypothetical protein